MNWLPVLQNGISPDGKIVLLLMNGEPEADSDSPFIFYKNICINYHKKLF